MSSPSFYLDEANTALESKAWFAKEKVIDSNLCFQLSRALKVKQSDKSLSVAALSKNHSNLNSKSMRDSSISWIEDWNETEGLRSLYKILDNIMLSVNNYFRLPIKSFESQFALYENGGFYEKHIDKTKKSNRRILSCIIYLNDCPEGGELVIYRQGSETEIAQVLSPKAGSLVLFFSDQIYHEVKPTKLLRLSLTTWFRDDLPL